MRKRGKNPIKTTIIYLLKWCFLLIVILPALLIAYYFIWGKPSCQEDSEAVAYARSLSPERLEKLYNDMEHFSRNGQAPIIGYQKYDQDSYVPEEFSDLEVGLIRPEQGNIMVEGCLDHYVYLNFVGVGSRSRPDDKKQIVLSWGDFPPNAGSEVLWSGQ